MSASRAQLISYVFPVFNESGTIPLLFESIAAVAAQRPEFDFEFIFVNDGSKDQSLEHLSSIAESDSRVNIVDLSRNFGHQIAVTAGLDASRGDAVIVMDADMQDPPSVSLELIDAWLAGSDVVYAQRRSRKDSLFKRATAAAYYRALAALSDIEIPQNTGDFRLMSRQVVDEMAKMREHNRYLRGMVSYIGFRQTAVQFDRDKRNAGTTGYPLRKMLKFAADGIMSFSTVPLKIISFIGYLVSAFAFAGIAYAVLMKIFAPDVTVEGWTFIVTSILFVGGIQMVMLGVLGSYVGRIYRESQGRPLYIVRDSIAYPSRTHS